MTDEQIVKALECCAIDYCNGCPLANEDIEEIGCDVNICFTAIDLIERQKTEIEYYKAEARKYQAFWSRSYNEYELTEAKAESKAEAIKEFVEMLKKEKMDGGWEWGEIVAVEDIDNLVKEMTEGE